MGPNPQRTYTKQNMSVQLPPVHLVQVSVIDTGKGRIYYVQSGTWDWVGLNLTVSFQDAGIMQEVLTPVSG